MEAFNIDANKASSTPTTGHNVVQCSDSESENEMQRAEANVIRLAVSNNIM